MADTVPHVVVFSLGGTIAMSGREDGTGVVPVLRSEDLVAAVPGLERVATITAVDFRRVPGASLRVDDLIELAAEIERVLDDGADGVIVTQGTDTIEETAYCLDLLLDQQRPVVVTGAMRNPTLPGADGPANLFAAAVVAASGLDLAGVVVVLGDEVHCARTVAKSHSTIPAAFTSPGTGPLGLVVEGRVVRRSSPVSARVHVPVEPGGQARPSVPILTIGLDDDGGMLAAADRADAVVLEALGVGHVPRWLAAPIGDLAARVPVVMTSRTRNGPVLRETYGFDGSERDLRARGVLGAGSLAAVKVRVLLLLLLRTGAGRAEIAEHLERLDRDGAGPVRSSKALGSALP